jgi:hypothetical protein
MLRAPAVFAPQRSEAAIANSLISSTLQRPRVSQSDQSLHSLAGYVISPQYILAI